MLHSNRVVRRAPQASVEITSRFTGKVLSIKYKVGEIARVGSPLCEIEVEAEEAEPERVPEPSASKASGEGTSLPSQAAQGAPGGTSSTAGSADLSGFTSSGRQNGAWPPPGASATQDSKRTPVFATPAVRRVAREHDLDLSLIQGTGKDARITKDDVLRHLEAVKAGGASASASTSRVADKADSASHGLWDGSSAQGHEESLPQNVPLDAMRRAMYRAMSSTLSVPHFGYADEIDVTELENLRVLLSSNIPTRYRKAQPPTSSVHSAPEEEGAVPEDARFDRLTLLPFLLKALSHAMLEPSHALFRSTLVHPPTSPPSHGSGAPISSPPSSAPAAQPHLSRRANCDISIALSTPSGLLTPTLPRVNLTSIYDLSSRIVQLSTRARSKGLNRTEMGNGGTITLSNVGAVGGGTYTHPLIPPTGQLAIGALGRARWLPRFESELPNNVQARATDGNAHTQNDKVVRRLVLNASFTADHRVVSSSRALRSTKEKHNCTALIDKSTSLTPIL